MLKISISRTPLPPPKKGKKPTSIQNIIGCLKALVLYHGCVALWGLIRVFTHLNAPISSLPYAAKLAVARLAVITLMFVLSFVVTYWLTDSIKHAKGWARLTYTILAILAFILTSYTNCLSPLLGVCTSSFIYLLGTNLSLAPILYLYRKDANEWFKQASQPHASPTQERESA